jgi:hypothetical protein
MQSGVRRLSITLWRTMLPQRWIAARNCEHCIVLTDCTMFNVAQMAAGEYGEASFEVDQGSADQYSTPTGVQQSQARAGIVRASNALIPCTASPDEYHCQENARSSAPNPWSSLSPLLSVVRNQHPFQHFQPFGISICCLRYLLLSFLRGMVP